MILINALSALRGGGQTYLIHLLENIPDSLQGKIVVLANTKNSGIFRSFPVKIVVSEFASRSIIHRMFFETFMLKKFLLQENITIYFSASGMLPNWSIDSIRFVPVFQNQLPFASKERKRFPYGYLRFKLLLLKYLQLKALKRSNLSVFLTEYSKKEILAHLAKPPGKSVVIPHGIEEQFRKREKHPKPEGLPEEYVLYVSILDAYKAQLEVIQAWDQLRKQRETKEKLLLIGPENPWYGKKVRELIEELNLQDEVLLLGGVPYRELPAYYQHAKVNVFASSCETFGIILLEKLAAGKPVFCSNYQPFPEIANDSVEFFDPYQPKTLTDLFLQYLDDKEALEKLGAKALDQSEKYDWKTTAKLTWDALYQEMVAVTKIKKKDL